MLFFIAFIIKILIYLFHPQQICRDNGIINFCIFTLFKFYNIGPLEFWFINPRFIKFKLKIKSILVSQPAPQGDSSPYLEMAKSEKIKIDFRPFIHVEGVDAKGIKNSKN